MISAFRTLRHIVIGLTAALAIITPLWFAAAGLGTRFGFWDYSFGLLQMTFGWGPNLLFAALGAGVISLILLIAYRIAFGKANAPGAGGWIAAVLAIAVGAGGLGYAASVREMAGQIPPIHDISTDTQNPPQFSDALIDRRGPDANSVDYASKIDPRSERPLPEVQAEAYPDIQPIIVGVEPELAYQAALNTARDLGWKIGTESESAGMFEATDTTFWYGFKDDVVVRVTALEEGGSRIDARSVSRVGVSDLGANAARISRFEERLRASLGEGA
ncbi:DUF1499 domain-containing protein [Oceanicaulis alexandrii]|uniref:DUF1499 domain-containing protein n=1 Tax=Oceanicaulis alexandrii TaxID=153233 RepID=UPI0035CEC3D9